MVELSIADGIAWLTLNRPEALNAVDRGVTAEFAAHIALVRDRDDVRVVVTRGSGRAFSAGSDLKDIAPMSPAEAAAAELKQGETFALLDALPQPTLAMLHGYVLGGGVGVALYHDFRIAARSTQFGMPEVELGWIPPWAMGRLVDVVGGANARWIAMVCEHFDAGEALRMSLVNEVVPDEALQNRVTTFASRLAALPPDGLRQTKALINQMSPLRAFEWDERAAEAFKQNYATAAAQANVAAFMARQKR